MDSLSSATNNTKKVFLIDGKNLTPNVL